MDLLRDKPAGRFSAARLFRPDSVVVIGAGSEVGGQVMANLRSGGFKGGVMAADTPESVAALPSAPDLAVVATLPTPDLLHALAAKGTFATVVVCGADGLSDPERRAGVRVLGPESFGIAVPGIGLNASRAHLPPPAGRIGLVSQSASLCRTVLDWAQPNGIGFSHIVGIGARADIGFGLVLDWLSRDPGTGAILLDIRQLRDRRAFLSAARAASRLRPVVALRPGGVLADPSGASERAFEAALRRAGVLYVANLEDLLAAAEILARARPVRSEALSIVTNAIGAGRMAADAVLRDGLQLAGDIVHVEPEDSTRLAALAGSRCHGIRRRRRPGGARTDRRGRSRGDRGARGGARRNEAAAPGLRHGRDHRCRLPAQPGRSRHGGVRHARTGRSWLPASGEGPSQPRRRPGTAEQHGAGGGAGP